MAFNGLEDAQNWPPFQVRYTASPYRKSKFPVDVVGESSSHWSNPPPTFLNGINGGGTTTSNGSHPQQTQHNIAYPFQYMNTGTNGGSTIQNNNNNHHFYQQNSSTYGEYLPQDSFSGVVQVNESEHYSIPGSDHHQSIGLPAQAPSHSIPSSDCHFFMRYPRHFPQNCGYSNNQGNQMEGILDEGYIEDLKQPYNTNQMSNSSNSNNQNNQNTKAIIGLGGVGNENNNLEYDPYSYVYDGKIQEDMSVTSVLCCGERDSPSAVSMPLPMQYNSGSLMALPSSRSNGENEYEEIRDVARYMNNSSGPLHFKSFSSTDDILAEVQQVQHRHDRVLDQLNLEVENLLISSTNDFVENSCSGGGSSGNCNSNNKSMCDNNVNWQLDKISSLSLNGIYQECYCDEIPSLPQFPIGGTLNSALLRPGGVVNCSSSSSLSKDSCCCVTGTNNKDEEIVVRNRRSNSLTLNNYHYPHNQQQHQLHDIGHKNKSVDEKSFVSSFSGNTGGNSLSTITTISRKKKLDREANQLNDSSLKQQLAQFQQATNNHHHHRHHILSSTSSHQDKHCKSRHHRSYSIIPSWKIREHLRRLPFLKQQHKLKKTEGPATSASTTIPISSSGQEFGANCKKMNSVMTSSKSTNNTTVSAASTNNTATNKTRSSSMDELRATEEHWYSADSDTEPDSFTAIPDSFNQVNNGKSPDSLSSTLTNRTDNGSRLDIGSIPEAKAPKFRRGTGLKDKWRESWSSTKTLSKPNMDEENKLLRWFSLRKNHANIEQPGSRHSALPLLSEEDLKRISYIEDEDGYWPRRQVQPPSLPPPPDDLSPEKITRRYIVAAIVHSENSYVAALQRLVNEYKKQLECSHPAILSHSKISSIFHRVPEILQCHSLFRIALAECVRRWDADEKIGDVFVASFSKSLVLDVYSEFLNSFGNAMETAKLEARRKSAFADFLKVKQMTAHDRLSLFGLMVKPVQRFPQFILLLQDLLKHTPKDHHDRMSLQLALTQLESLAAMLNERKRESEQYQAFRETIKSIGGSKFVLLRNIVDDPNRILLRQDVVTQLEFDNSGAAVAKSKCRKLLLLNDTLICVALQMGAEQQSSSGSSSHSSDINSNGLNNNNKEKSVFKWSYPVQEVLVEDISISPTMSRFVHGGSNTINNSANASNRNSSLKMSSSASGTAIGLTSLPEEMSSMSLLEEMQALMYDYEVLSRILTLVSSLKSQYEGLTEASVKELMLEIQHQIRTRDEQISFFDSSCLTLLLGTGNNRDKVVFQMSSPTARSEWIEELKLAQLALDPNNSPSWDIPSEYPYPNHKLPLFVRALPLTKSPHLITVKCGCFFTHTFVSPTGRSKIFDNLWVSSTDGFSSHISAFRSTQNTLKEVSSFDLVEEKINDLIFVSGYVWLATESRKIMVFDPNDTDKGSVSSYILSDGVLKLALFDGRVYAGLADGNLAVFTQVQDPKVLKPDHVIKIGQDKVSCVFGQRDHVYAACGNAIVSIDIKTYTIEVMGRIWSITTEICKIAEVIHKRNVVITHHNTIDNGQRGTCNGPIAHVACSGVGLWISTQDSGTVCLYHLESLQHLQDVSIAPSVFRTVRDSFRRQKGCSVTCLTAHKGWLWIGTSLGVILTIPLPRLEGVPIISTGKANVSYHGYSGPVTFLMPLTKSPAPPLSSSFTRHLANKSSEVIPTITTTNTTIVTSSTVNSELDKKQVTNNTIIIKTEDISENNNKISSKTTSLSFDDAVNISTKESDNNTINKDTDVGSQSQLNGDNTTTTTSAVTDNHNDSTNSLTRTLSDTGSVGENHSMSKTLVVLRKKNSRDSVFRNCKTLPRGGPIPANLRFSIDSDVYGLYGNLINVRGLEDEGRFVDPLYDALRRSDPELVALDAKISTLDRRLKMRMSRPRSLDLSNWSVDSKISASSDESVGLGTTRSSANDATLMQDNTNAASLPLPLDASAAMSNNNHVSVAQESAKTNGSTTNKKTVGRPKKSKGQAERTVVVVVGGRGYLNMRNQSQDHFITNSGSGENSEKLLATLTVWQMKT